MELCVWPLKCVEDLMGSDVLTNICEGIRNLVSTLAVDILFQLCTN